MKNVVLTGLLVVSVITINSCTANNPVAPSAPVTQTLWKNGVAGPWWGQAVGISIVEGCRGAGTGSFTTAAVVDNITGDTAVLQVTAPAECGLLMFSINNAVDASGYYATGALKFDIMLGPAFNPSTDLLGGAYGVSSTDLCYTSNTTGLNSTTFTQVSIPLTVFSLPVFSCNKTAAMKFAGIAVNLPSPGAPGVLFYINNVRWVP